MASKPSSVVPEAFFDADSIITVDEIASVKLKLMSSDPASQISSVSWIAKKLKMSSNADRERLVETLIANDVITYLCEKIGCSHGHLFTSMIDILENLVISVNFYKRNLAKSAVDSILRVAFIMAKKMEAHEKTLSSAVYTLYIVLDGAKTAKVLLQRVCDLPKMAIFLKNLTTRLSTCYILRLSAARLLCLVIENIELGRDEETKLSLLTAFEDFRLGISGVVLEQMNSEDTEIWQTALALLCSACAAATRFCTGFKGEDFIKEIKRAMITILIPYYKSIKFESKDFMANAKRFVVCLDQIFALRTDNSELAKILASHGYLKYFLLMPFANFRKTISSLLSQIIATLSEGDFSCEDLSTLDAKIGKPEGWTEFRNSINEGIRALPSTTDHTMDTSLILNTRNTSSNAFLMLLYHHSLKTLEFDIISLPSVILKTVTLSGEQPIPVLKATWFLFAISSLEHSADSVSYYEEAAKNLADLLQKHNLRKCYTHNPAVLKHSLNCGELPVELRYEVVRLWLEFDGDLKLLLGDENSELITECLLSTVETSSRKLVSRALEVIVELRSDEKRWNRIHSRVWDRLPRALASWTPETLANVKGLLKLVTGTKPEGKCLEMYEESAATLAKALTSKELDDELKMLLLRYVYTLLEVSLARDSPSVVTFCLSEPRLLRILRDTGFTKENFQLSAFCIDTLAFIVECQRVFKVQCNESACVKIEPLQMLVLLARSKYELYRGSVRLLVVLLNHREGMVSFGVSLSDFENAEAADEAMYAWYNVLYQRLDKTHERDWRLIYRCLIAMLTFCERHKFHGTIRRLCDCCGNYELMRWTMEHEYTDSIFFEFAELWLSYGYTYRSPNVESAVCSRRFNNPSIGLTEYDRVIEMLRQYRGKYWRETPSQ